MTTETLDKLYLEWSNFTSAKTGREVRMETIIRQILKEPTGCVYCDSGVLRPTARSHTLACGWDMAQREMATLNVERK